MLDKAFYETYVFANSDDICFWSSFLFALTSWNLALWVIYIAEEGVGLTTKQDKVFFQPQALHTVAKML